MTSRRNALKTIGSLFGLACSGAAVSQAAPDEDLAPYVDAIERFAAKYDGFDKRGMSAPLGVYQSVRKSVRPVASSLPAVEVLRPLVVQLRRGDRAQALATCTKIGTALWERWRPRRLECAQVRQLDTYEDRHMAQAIVERLITPHYTCDIAEVSPRGLARMLACPIDDLAGSLRELIGQADEKAATQGGRWEIQHEPLALQASLEDHSFSVSAGFLVAGIVK